MTSKSETGTVEEYQGQKLTPAREYAFDYQVFDNLAEAKQSDSWPSDNEVLKFVNQRSKTSAKAAAYQKETADLKKSYEDSPEFKRKNLYNSAVAAGMTHDQAEAICVGAFGS